MHIIFIAFGIIFSLLVLVKNLNVYIFDTKVQLFFCLRNFFRKFSVLLFCLQLGVERNICEELIGLVLVIHAQTVVLQTVADDKIVDVEKEIVG